MMKVANVDGLLTRRARCTFTARHVEKLGWHATHPASHILEAAEEETALILENIKK